MEFIKHGEEDPRYYNLIYKMLTHQSGQFKTFPLGFQMDQFKGFNEKVLFKLPQEMQKQLRQEAIYHDDEGWDSNAESAILF